MSNFIFNRNHNQCCRQTRWLIWHGKCRTLHDVPDCSPSSSSRSSSSSSSSSLSSSSSSSSSSLTEDLEFDLKKAPDGTPVPHSSIGATFDEGSGVDPIDGRGTVEPEGEGAFTSSLLRREHRAAGVGSISTTHIKRYVYKQSVQTNTNVQASTRFPLHSSGRFLLHQIG